jgi:hypothetical protein
MNRENAHPIAERKMTELVRNGIRDKGKGKKSKLHFCTSKYKYNKLDNDVSQCKHISGLSLDEVLMVKGNEKISAFRSLS